MGRTCFKCDKDIVVGKTITPSKMYEGLNEVEIHTECYRCRRMRKSILNMEKERRELGRKYRELSKRINTYKGLMVVIDKNYM